MAGKFHAGARFHVGSGYGAATVDVLKRHGFKAERYGQGWIYVEKVTTRCGDAKRELSRLRRVIDERLIKRPEQRASWFGITEKGRSRVLRVCPKTKR